MEVWDVQQPAGTDWLTLPIHILDNEDIYCTGPVFTHGFLIISRNFPEKNHVILLLGIARLISKCVATLFFFFFSRGIIRGCQCYLGENTVVSSYQPKVPVFDDLGMRLNSQLSFFTRKLHFVALSSADRNNSGRSWIRAKKCVMQWWCSSAGQRSKPGPCETTGWDWPYSSQAVGKSISTGVGPDVAGIHMHVI